MSKQDSDLYGDIYGDEDNEPTASSSQEGQQLNQPLRSAVKESSLSNNEQETVSDAKDVSLPAKPSVAEPTLSYSAQIAQQFSAYQQTPSQERQQRKEIPLPQNPRLAGSAPSVNYGISDSVFGKKPSEMHDAGKLFIGGLSWDTTDEGLRDYFSQFGKVDACTIMRDASGTSRGFAFLTFEDPNAVNAVVVREHFLDGKAIDPKRAIPREEHLRNTRYFVGGLSPTTTSDSMKEFFSTYGKVVDATVMIDRESGRSKGFGFVTFEDASNLDQLVGKNGLVLDDKQIEVKLAQPRSQRDQARSATQSNVRESNFSSQTSSIAPMSVPFISQQTNPMSFMYQRSVGQLPMMGTPNVPMMSVNPMTMAMGMGMGMGGFGPIANMSGMNAVNGMNNMGNLGAMRLGMGPMGTSMGGMAPMMGNMPLNGLGGIGLGMRQGIVHGGMNMNAGRATMSGGMGPSRMTSRGQHSYHPYAR